MENENKQAMETGRGVAFTLAQLEALDMDAIGYDEDPGEAKYWRITDDACADWAVQKIAAERAEVARLRDLAEAQIKRISDKLYAAEQRCNNSTNYLTAKLAEYFETVPTKATKTQRKYRLLSGTLTKKLGGVSMKQSADTLLAYLKASGNEEYIKTTEEPRWGDYKKRLEIVGGNVVDTATGDIVEGVEIVQKPDTFSVDV